MPSPSIVAACAVALLAVQPVTASARPDLGLVSAKLVGRDYTFIGDTFTFRFEARTRNAGSTAAPRSRTRLWLVGPSGAQQFVLQIQVPPLPSRNSYAATATRRYLIAANQPPGAYDVRICVDRRYSSSRTNDCRTFRKSFFVAARTWAVAATGEGPVYQQEIVERWTVQARTSFNFTRYFPKGKFRYGLLGAVSYQDSGVANGCNWSGASLSGALQGQLSIDYLKNEYTAVGGAPTLMYPIINDCDPVPNRGPVWPNIIDTGFGRVAQPRIAFGQRTLQGQYADDVSGYKNNWTMLVP